MGVLRNYRFELCLMIDLSPERLYVIIMMVITDRLSTTEENVTLNRQDKWDDGQCVSRGIEWTQVYGRPGYTWNPTGGCKHGCTWRMPDGSVTECYAKTVAERLASHAYPNGFDHHYWRPHALLEPLKIKKPAGIFVGSMADLFGHWVPQEHIEKVLEVTRKADWHIFQTLSKYPIRLKSFQFPPNVWVGVSLPAGQLMNRQGATRALTVYLQHMASIEVSTRFISIEPLWFDVAPVFIDWLAQNGKLPFEWVIIGAASNGTRIYQPKPSWVSSLLEILDDQGLPVFFKGNLKDNEAAQPWREEFPAKDRSAGQK